MKQEETREKLSQGCLLGPDLSLCCKRDTKKSRVCKESQPLSHCSRSHGTDLNCFQYERMEYFQRRLRNSLLEGQFRE